MNKVIRAGKILFICCVLALFAAQGLYAQEGGKNSIKIGAAVSLSGKYAREGEYTLKGYQAWQQWINDQGGVFVKDLNKKLKIELVWYDDQGDKETGMKLYEKLATGDKVDLAFGPYSSSITYAITPVLDKHKIFNLDTEGMSEHIFKRNLKYVVSTVPSTKVYCDSVLDAAKTLGIKKIAFLYAKQEWPMDNTSAAKEKAKALGMEIVYDQAFPLDAVDYTSMLADIKNAAPDALIGGAYFPQAVAIRKQMKEIGLNVKLLALYSGPLMADWVEALGPDANGVMAPSTWTSGYARQLQKKGVISYGPSYDEFLSVIDKAFKLKEENLDPRVPCGFNAGLVLQKIIEEAGTLNSEKLREAANVVNGKIMTFYGEYKIVPETGESLSRCVALQWQNGVTETIEPEEYSTAKPVVMQDAK